MIDFDKKEKVVVQPVPQDTINLELVEKMTIEKEAAEYSANLTIVEIEKELIKSRKDGKRNLIITIISTLIAFATLVVTIISLIVMLAK